MDFNYMNIRTPLYQRNNDIDQGNRDIKYIYATVYIFHGFCEQIHLSMSPLSTGPVHILILWVLEEFGTRLPTVTQTRVKVNMPWNGSMEGGQPDYKYWKTQPRRIMRIPITAWEQKQASSVMQLALWSIVNYDLL